MTVTMPAQPGQDSGLQPMPWREMAWVTWRQHRAALGSVAALACALALHVVSVGLQAHHTWAANMAACHIGSIPCQGTNSVLGNSRGQWHGQTSMAGLLQLVPALIGAFAGVPVLARELETGTFRYAWTQGFGLDTCVRHNSGCLEVPAALERRSAGRHLLASVKLPRDANSAGLAGT
jgi:hypothetical protein